MGAAVGVAEAAPPKENPTINIGKKLMSYDIITTISPSHLIGMTALS